LKGYGILYEGKPDKEGQELGRLLNSAPGLRRGRVNGASTLKGNFVGLAKGKRLKNFRRLSGEVTREGERATTRHGRKRKRRTDMERSEDEGTKKRKRWSILYSPKHDRVPSRCSHKRLADEREYDQEMIVTE